MLRNLRGARGMPGVVAHGWAALLRLLVVLASALSLAGHLARPAGARPRRRAGAAPGVRALRLHGHAGAGAVVHPGADVRAGRRARRARRSLTSCGLALAALVLAGVGGASARRRSPLRIAALLAGSAAVGAAPAADAAQALRSGMRRRAGALVHAGEDRLGRARGQPAAGAGRWCWNCRCRGWRRWFGLCLIGVWLLSLLLGMLQRILPFLAAMHAGGSGPARAARLRRSRTTRRCACISPAMSPRSRCWAWPPRWTTPGWSRAGAAAGAVGALAFAWFFAVVLRRMRRQPDFELAQGLPRARGAILVLRIPISGLPP